MKDFLYQHNNRLYGKEFAKKKLRKKTINMEVNNFWRRLLSTKVLHVTTILHTDPVTGKRTHRSNGATLRRDDNGALQYNMQNATT